MQLSWSAGFAATDYSRACAVSACAVYLAQTAAGIIGERPAAGRYGCQLQSGFVQRHFVNGGLDFVAYCVVGFF